MTNFILVLLFSLIAVSCGGNDEQTTRNEVIDGMFYGEIEDSRVVEKFGYEEYIHEEKIYVFKPNGKLFIFINDFQIGQYMVVASYEVIENRAMIFKLETQIDEHCNETKNSQKVANNYTYNSNSLTLSNGGYSDKHTLATAEQKLIFIEVSSCPSVQSLVQL